MAAIATAARSPRLDDASATVDAALPAQLDALAATAVTIAAQLARCDTYAIAFPTSARMATYIIAATTDVWLPQFDVHTTVAVTTT